MRWIIVLLSLLFLEAGGRAPRPALDAQAPAHLETAVFAMGWFWGPDSRFGSLPGVVRTEVGYAGGRAPQPNYGNIQDHSECIRITYDPSRLSYSQLLAMFWAGNHPFRPAYARQYRSAILYQNEEQHKLAQETKPKGTVYSSIEPLGTFTLAEDYHQKYYLRNTPVLFQEFHAMYPNEGDFMRSTAAARANGFLGGYGSPADFEHDLPRLGLSEKAQKVLRENKPGLKCGG